MPGHALKSPRQGSCRSSRQPTGSSAMLLIDVGSKFEAPTDARIGQIPQPLLELIVSDSSRYYTWTLTKGRHMIIYPSLQLDD